MHRRSPIKVSTAKGFFAWGYALPGVTGGFRASWRNGDGHLGRGIVGGKFRSCKAPTWALLARDAIGGRGMRAGKQTTLCDEASVSGIGVHSGSPVTLTLHPADAGTGIVFLRTGSLLSPKSMPSVATQSLPSRSTNSDCVQTLLPFCFFPFLLLVKWQA